MKAFVNLFEDLDSTTSTLEKVSALKLYFSKTSHSDSMWAVLLLTGKLSKRVLTSRNLRDLFLIATKYPEWLLEECASQVGDTAETLSLLAQSLNLSRTFSIHSSSEEFNLSQWMDLRIPELAAIDDQEEQARILISWWKTLLSSEIFILNKLMTGAFRVGVSEKLVIRALSEHFEIPSDQVAHRLIGIKKAGAENFTKLISKDFVEVSFSQPYPFCLAHSFSDRTNLDFKPEDWCIEWKYDGIRAQVIKRSQQVWIWSRGEEDITAGFPDLAEAFKDLPEGSVIDGEILVLKNGEIQLFQDLQKRLGRKKPSAAILKTHPAGFVGYDCLEFNGVDRRQESLRARRDYLKKIISNLSLPQIKISEAQTVTGLDQLENLRSEARNHQAEGLMIKGWDSTYTVGRKTGSWWKHKVDPLSLDAVLLYAQAGTGRRANLYTDYTFALWDNDPDGQDKKLVTFAKAYSGLDQDEINKLDHWIRRNTKEKFGPVRSLEPEHVFEIAFEGISKSDRHKSGIAVRFPRILRWRHDKKVEDADTLQTALALLKSQEILS